MVTIPISGGPLDGGTFEFSREPEHLATVYAAFQPSNVGWTPDRPTVRPEHVQQVCSLVPGGRQQSRYAYSARAKKFLYDGTAVYLRSGI